MTRTSVRGASDGLPLLPDNFPWERRRRDRAAGPRITSGLLAAVIVGATWLPVTAQTPRFSQERPITARRGPQRLPVDLPLLGSAKSFRIVQRGDRRLAEGGLSDLRLFTPDGTPVPYLLLHPPDASPQWTSGRVLAIPATKTTSGFEVDLGVMTRVEALKIEGLPAPFLKRLTLEGSGDRTRWTMLAGEGTLFDLPAERMRQTELDFAPGEYRYLRVVWDDTSSGRVPLPASVSARPAVRADTTPSATLDIPFERAASEPGRTRYRLRLPAGRLPIVGISLDVGGGHVFRQAMVTESRFDGTEAAPAQLGAATLSRVVRDGIRASSLHVPIAPPAESELQLLIDDGSNPPLEVKRISAVLAELPFIFFEAPGEALMARYGNPGLDAPHYDLEALRGSVDITGVAEAVWGEPRALVETAGRAAPSTVPEPGRALDPEGFQYRRNIPAAAGLLALTLDAAVLAHSRGPASRFADVRVLDGQHRQIPYLIERRDEPLEVTLAIVGASASAATPPGQQRSVYRVSQPYERLPTATLLLDTPARIFHRSVQIGFERPPDRQHRDTWFDVRSTDIWRHADEQAPAPPLSVRVEGTASRDLLVVIDEGDNAPLPLNGARLLLPTYRLRFYNGSGAPVQLAYGRTDLQPPQYDLALLAEHVMGAPARDVAADAEQERNGAAAAPLVPAWLFWTLLGAAVLVLLGVIARLARTA
jgi:hypothetical protein